MVVHRIGVGHEQCAHAGSRQLGNGKRAGAAHHQICHAVSCGHIINKFATFSLHTGFGIALAQAFQLAAPALVAHLGTLLGRQQGQRFGQQTVENIRAQTAAGNQQLQAT